MTARNDADTEDQDYDYPEYNVRFSTTEPCFEGVDMKIYEDANGYTIYNDIDKDVCYTREHKDDVFIYTDIETGEKYQGKALSEEEAGEYGSSEYKDAMYEGSMRIEIGKGAVLKDMIGNMKHLSAPIYMVARKDEFYFLMISDPAAGSTTSTGKKKKIDHDAIEAGIDRPDNGIYVKVSVKTKVVSYT